MKTQMPLSRFLLMLLCLFAMGGRAPSVFAQGNPAAAACGLPAEGIIKHSATYTLTANCSQTGLLTIGDFNPKISLTINGGGYTITRGPDSIIFGPNAILNLNNVTIDGASTSDPSLIHAERVNASNVTFTRGRGIALFTSEGNLNNVLFDGIVSGALSLGGNASALLISSGTNHSLTNVVFRNNLGGGGAVVLRSGSRVTTNGCLTLSGNAPYDVFVAAGATWTDNSSGLCSGTIGNGDQAEPAPELMACGFPAGGNLDASATYTLTADCELTARYYVSEDVSLRVIGNGYSLRDASGLNTIYTAATSEIRLENVALDGVFFYHWGRLTADGIKVSNSVGGFLYNMGEAHFRNGLFEGNSSNRPSSRSVALAYSVYQNGFTSFTDATFRNNTGGLGVLATWGATIELNGCITFENNSPADTYIYARSGGVLNDNSVDCDSPIIDPVNPVAPTVKCNPHCDLPPAPPVKCNPHCDLPPAPQDDCSLKLGAIGLICRPPVQPPVATVWRIRPNPAGTHLPAFGTFLLAVDQLQVEAVADGLVACSPDGRLAIRTGLTDELRQVFENSPQYSEELLVPRRYIVFSKGPEPNEDKVHHIVLDNALDGRVFGIVDTFGGPPAPECIEEQPAQPASQPTTPKRVYAAPVQPQAPQPGGSIVHVVQLGDTISAIAVAYRAHQLDIIMLNQLEAMGRWIYPGQELLIREADA